MAEFELKIGTAEARNHASELKNAEQVYKNIVENLTSAKSQIQMNWEGDAADITDIITRIDAITGTFQESIIPCLNQLHTGVTNYADEVDRIGNTTVEEGSGAGGSAGGGANGGSGKSTARLLTKDFWKGIGEDFKDDWDFSDTTGLLSGVSNVLEGVTNFGGTVVNASTNVISGLLDFILK